MKSFVGQLSSSGAVVNSAIVRAAARGIILAKDANLLEENGGGINLTKDWANRLLARMGYVKRKATTKAKIPPALQGDILHCNPCPTVNFCFRICDFC